MDFRLYFRERISMCHHFKMKLEGWNFQDLITFMQTMTRSICVFLAFSLKYVPWGTEKGERWGHLYISLISIL